MNDSRLAFKQEKRGGKETVESRTFEILKSIKLQLKLRLFKGADTGGSFQKC